MRHRTGRATSPPARSRRPARPGFIASLSLKLVTRLYAPTELLPAHNLNIMNHGVAVRGGQVFVQGCVWGQDFILANPALRHRKSVRAMGYVEVYTLTHRCLSLCPGLTGLALALHSVAPSVSPAADDA